MYENKDIFLNIHVLYVVFTRDVDAPYAFAVSYTADVNKLSLDTNRGTVTDMSSVNICHTTLDNPPYMCEGIHKNALVYLTWF